MNSKWVPLAQWAAALKQQNKGFYDQFVAALHEGVDPEHKALVAAPADGILKQQGRTQLGVELLETVHTCEKIAADFQMSLVPTDTQWRPMGVPHTR